MLATLFPHRPYPMVGRAGNVGWKIVACDCVGLIVVPEFEEALLKDHNGFKLKTSKEIGFAWIFLDLPGFAWICLDLPGFAWICLDLPGFACICQDLPAFVCIFLYLLGLAWICLDLLGCAWSLAHNCAFAYKLCSTRGGTVS